MFYFSLLFAPVAAITVVLVLAASGRFQMLAGVLGLFGLLVLHPIPHWPVFRSNSFGSMLARYFAMEVIWDLDQHPAAKLLAAAALRDGAITKGPLIVLCGPH